MRLLAPVVLLASAFILTTDADAADRRVALGEVSSRVQRADLDVPHVLRASAQSEIDRLDLAHTRTKEKVIVSVSLVRMEDESSAATCVVSATLRTAKSGNVFAIVEGKARASQPQANAHENALRGAVHGALARVPDVLTAVAQKSSP